LTTARPARLLFIAGSDSSGGAGIQADIKTATVLGAYAMTAITAVTVQDTTKVHAIHRVPAAIVREQLAWSLADIGADSIKIGMLGCAEAANAVADVLEREARGIPIVLDPVMTSTAGTALLEEPGVAVLKTRILPLATVVTPNILEAEILTDVGIGTPDDVMLVAKRLCAMGAKAVLVKGGHSKRDDGNVRDTLVECGSGEPVYFESPRIETRHTHGTGCTLAAALAVGLAQGLSLRDAAERAHRFVHEAIRTAPGFGAGHGPLNHMHGIHTSD
jgi:hydroxymethylpyrimidine/phosphomethylpyrimidine kinase